MQEIRHANAIIANAPISLAGNDRSFGPAVPEVWAMLAPGVQPRPKIVQLVPAFVSRGQLI